MKWRIHTVGKPALAHAKLGVGDYLGRLRRYAPCELVHSKEGALEEVAASTAKTHPSWLRIVLDERGEAMNTATFAAKVERWRQDGVDGAFCFIGGADGHSQALRDRADLVLSLSALTLQHELALVVLLEQLYRVHTILRGEPYHR